MAGDERQQRVAEGTGHAAFRPFDGSAIAVRFGAVVGERGAAAVETKGGAGEDVEGEGEGDEEGFEDGGLVVGACEEEVAG